MPRNNRTPSARTRDHKRRTGWQDNGWTLADEQGYEARRPATSRSRYEDTPHADAKPKVTTVTKEHLHFMAGQLAGVGTLRSSLYDTRSFNGLVIVEGFTPAQLAKEAKVDAEDITRLNPTGFKKLVVAGRLTGEDGGKVLVRKDASITTGKRGGASVMVFGAETTGRDARKVNVVVTGDAEQAGNRVPGSEIYLGRTGLQALALRGDIDVPYGAKRPVYVEVALETAHAFSPTAINAMIESGKNGAYSGPRDDRYSSYRSSYGSYSSPFDPPTRSHGDDYDLPYTSDHSQSRYESREDWF